MIRMKVWIEAEIFIQIGPWAGAKLKVKRTQNVHKAQKMAVIAIFGLPFHFSGMKHESGIN